MSFETKWDNFTIVKNKNNSVLSLLQRDHRKVFDFELLFQMNKKCHTKKYGNKVIAY